MEPVLQFSTSSFTFNSAVTENPGEKANVLGRTEGVQVVMCNKISRAEWGPGAGREEREVTRV